jgi:hypothetical protein
VASKDLKKLSKSDLKNFQSDPEKTFGESHASVGILKFFWPAFESFSGLRLKVFSALFWKFFQPF